MSADYTTTVGYGSTATIVEGADLTILEAIDYHLGLKYVTVVSFGDYRVEDITDMEIAVLLSSTVDESYGESIDFLPSDYTPEITDKILAELDKVREYLDFGDVTQFDWITGSSIV